MTKAGAPALMPPAHLRGTQFLIERALPHSREFGEAIKLCAMILHAKMAMECILKFIVWTCLSSIDEQVIGEYSSMQILKRYH